MAESQEGTSSPVDVCDCLFSSCLGIWNDEFIPGLKRIVDIAHYYGSKIGIQVRLYPPY